MTTEWKYTNSGIIQENRVILADVMGAFKFSTLIKESIQNSLDAGLDGKVVEVSFKLLKIKDGYSKVFDAFSINKTDFIKNFEKMKEFYIKNSRAREIYLIDNLIELFKSDFDGECYSLMIQDRNTTGLTISKNEDQISKFDAFFFFKGIGSKDNGQRGSHGQGRHAILHGSKAQMMMVETKPYNDNNVYKFGMGIHGLTGDSKNPKSGITLFGNWEKSNQKPKPVIVPNRRFDGECGTNIALPFFKIDDFYDTLKDKEKYSDIYEYFFKIFEEETIKWFFPAIAKKKLKIILESGEKSNFSFDSLSNSKKKIIDHSSLSSDYPFLEELIFPNEGMIYFNEKTPIQVDNLMIWLKNQSYEQKGGSKKKKYSFSRVFPMYIINKKNCEDLILDKIKVKLFDNIADSIICIRDNMVIEYKKIVSSYRQYSKDLSIVFELSINDSDNPLLYELLKSSEPFSHDRWDGEQAGEKFPHAKRRIEDMFEKIKGSLNKMMEEDPLVSGTMVKFSPLIKEMFPKKLEFQVKKTSRPRSNFESQDLDVDYADNEEKEIGANKKDDSIKKQPRKKAKIKQVKTVRSPKSPNKRKKKIKTQSKKSLNKNDKDMDKKEDVFREKMKNIQILEGNYESGGISIDLKHLSYENDKNYHLFEITNNGINLEDLRKISYIFYYDESIPKDTKLSAKCLIPESSKGTLRFKVYLDDIPASLRQFTRVYYSVNIHKN